MYVCMYVYMRSQAIIIIIIYVADAPALFDAQTLGLQIYKTPSPRHYPFPEIARQQGAYRYDKSNVVHGYHLYLRL